MKIQDARGLEVDGNFHQVHIGGPVVIEVDGTSVEHPDIVVYVREDKVDEFKNLREHFFFKIHGYK